jgi:hypothetical protein
MHVAEREDIPCSVLMRFADDIDDDEKDLTSEEEGACAARGKVPYSTEQSAITHSGSTVFICLQMVCVVMGNAAALVAGR